MFNFRGPSPVITLIPDSRFQAFSFIQHSNRTYASAVNVEVDEEEKVGIIGTRLDMGVHRSGCFLVFFFLVLEECNVHLSPGVFIQMFFVLSLLWHSLISASCILHIPCQPIGSYGAAVVQYLKTRKCNKRYMKSQT